MSETMHDLSGCVAVVTGATSGLGQVTAHVLAAHGATVVLAARNPAKSSQTMAAIRSSSPDADVRAVSLDLADLASVRSAADEILADHPRIDLLVNNAGLMAPPLSRTIDGFELQLGTNHLGHFALTGLLLEALMNADAARVVTVSSGFHRMGRMDFSDLNWEHGYRRWPAYGRSKLANLLFMLELARRLDAAGSSTISVGAHPGYAATHLQTASAEQQRGLRARAYEAAATAANRVVAQSAEDGARPQLHAATHPAVTNGSYWGPSGPGELRGRPAPAAISKQARNPVDARRLWEVSEALTGVTFHLGPAPADSRSEP